MMSSVIAVSLLLAVSVAPPPLQELAGRALAAPPEIAADILIRTAESPKTTGAWKLELLETAFQIAGGARYPLKRVAAVAIPEPEVVWTVFDRKLDTLSLQVRIARAVHALDAARGLETFDRIVLPRIAPLGCADALGYSLHDYYALAAELLSRDPDRIVAMARGMSSVWQLEPIARMLTRVSLPHEDFRRAVLGYAAALRQITADDRSFGAATASLNLPLDELRRRVHTRDLADAWDEFQSRHRSEPRCTDPALAPALVSPITHPILDDADLLLGPARLR